MRKNPQPSNVECPSCGALLEQTAPRDRANRLAWALLVIGILTAPFMIGILLVVLASMIGFTVRKPGYYQCERCGWNSRDFSWYVQIRADGSKAFLPPHHKRET
jgi:predicted RNA-binding Zn-ribbon protein involved in translation (DUF1610 family)